MSKHKAKVIELRADGLRNFEIAERLGISQWYVSRLLSGCGIQLPQHKKSRERAKVMAEMYRSGQTLQAIGDQYSLTRERVRQIIASLGVTRLKGGQHMASTQRKIERAAKKDERYLVRYGCTYAQFLSLQTKDKHKSIYRRPVRAFQQQRNTASLRGIEWKFLLWEWWQVWQQSGKWELRGRGQGYCMARFNDTGPYAAGNVYICTIGQNFSDSYKVHPWHERFPHVARSDPNKLTDIESNVFELRKTGMKYREIASELNLPMGTISWTLGNAKTKISRLAVSA